MRGLLLQTVIIGVVVVGGTARAQDVGVSKKQQETTTMNVGLRMMMLPVGSITASMGNLEASESTAFAFGFSPYFEYVPHQIVSIGLGPEFVFNVAGENAPKSAQFININARLRAGYPVLDALYTYVLVTPGYSVGLTPDPLPTAHGFNIGFAGGARYTFAGNFAALFEMGYNLGFQTMEQNGASVDFNPSYFQINMGAEYAF